MLSLRGNYCTTALAKSSCKHMPLGIFRRTERGSSSLCGQSCGLVNLSRICQFAGWRCPVRATSLYSANRGVVRRGHPQKAGQLREEGSARLLILLIKINTNVHEELLNSMGHSAGTRGTCRHVHMLLTPPRHAIAPTRQTWTTIFVNLFLDQSMNLQV
ncbi:hypothetical protein M440DRAFT_1245361 [Trichoderma longibrachiatum ATCC 18648]|uniref:Uncharacterized protein n=1 Tax=Trichoderma longibrachiatum ATCC 18648 TaxID=983965 RepID=A0A2T4C3G6_TRILO|nr:hypothetical protein M440DRAFT_1245361 [Trichoderma longibrachiatum ATCC 18648]